jgi:hypothetical protein
MAKRIWTHEEMKAAADGDIQRMTMLSRRSIVQGGLAVAGGALMAPFLPHNARAAVGGEIHTFTWEGFDNIEPTKCCFPRRTEPGFPSRSEPPLIMDFGSG